ncbi:ABC transporter permease [Thermomonas sp.]|uniref:ABC transporter permease n=1 Tax=Thermomonas sp. TaxID=1971895 RepID=UPI001AC462BB|nr:FtsX-like permease family protein [Xanthomonadales bacterium]MBN8768622.1 FtsX-like permease family protein [Stenotrophomonas sp.]
MAARQAWSGWRNGEFGVLLAALFVAVLALAGVGSLAQRTSDALAEQSRRLVGGDAAFTSDDRAIAAALGDARRLGLRAYRSVELASMVGRRGGVPELGMLKALSGDPPLLGPYTVRTPDGVRRLPRPAPGTLWLSASGAARLGVQPGGLVEVGGRPLRLAGIVLDEPDRPLNGVELGPRVILPLAEVEAGGLLGPGARARWRVTVAGPPAAVNAWVKAREAARGPGDRVETGDDLNPQLKLALDRAQRFLAVSLVLTAALAAVAIGMAARQHAERHRAIAATLRALGAGQRAIAGLYVAQLGLLGGIAILLALLAALVLQQLAGLWVARALGTALPAASAWPLLKGGLVGLWILATFALPPLLALRRVSALAVLRQDLRTPSPPALLLFGLALGGLLALFWQAAGNATTGAVLLGGLLATAAVLGLAGWSLAALVARAGRAGSGIVRYALLNLSRRRRLTIAQVVALGLSLMALLLLLLVRTDVWDQWQASVRADAPNRFVINVQPDQRPAFDAVLARLGLRPASFSPLIRARYVGPSAQQRGRPAPQGRGERLLDREFNLSTAAALPTGNTLRAGAFWNPQTARNEFSVETRFAEQLRWRLGDTLAFDVAGRRIEGRITSLRDVRWESFTPNFFVLASPDLARGLPATYITAVKVPVGDTRLAVALAQAVPNANVIDIDAITGEIRRIGDQAARVIQVVFWFAFLSGCLVFVAAVATTRRERITELGVLRTLGASSAQLRLAQLVEFGAIGAIAGGIAALAAAGIGTLFAQRVLDLPPTWSGSTLAIGALGGMLAAMLAGWLSLRRQLGTSVRETLGAGAD